ncbi:arginine repressor [Defluviitalea phaphyphila]|uniref:arginine repressor n=1 Tax=Defluviitalea phaphyphila TaxID=1473580 RepID=UPI0007309283|nr:arginine repressor [Defluviitalea phaphyphila]
MKIKRQSKILELINNNSIETQEELAEKLREAGFEVTQATISRDIRELKLTKIPTEHGTQKYATLIQNEQHISEKFIRVFKEGFVSMDKAQNILVIKTLTGMAMAVAAAMDAFHYEEIVGTIAGDDTIFCAIKSEEDTIRLMEKLKGILNSK